jgi:PAS domain S-box-containing protein
MPVARAIRGEATDDVEEFIRNPKRPEGLWLNVSSRPLKDETGAVIGGVSVYRDITAYKQAEAAHRQSEALYHSLVESLPLSMFRKDLEGRSTFGNQRFCATMGRSLDEILGKTDFDFCPRELAEKYRRDDQSVVATGQTLEDIEEHQIQGGDKRYIHVLKTPVCCGDGTIIGIQVLFWDIAEAQRPGTATPAAGYR